MSRPSTLPAKWLALANAVGGVGALAKACYTTPMSVHRWGCGMRPKSEQTRKCIAKLAEKYELPNPLGGEL